MEKRIFFVIYKTKHEFGKTHISICEEGEQNEWAYGRNGISSASVGHFSDGSDGWAYSSMVSIGKNMSKRSLSEIVDDLKPTYTEEQYHLIQKNCWHFAAEVMQRTNKQSVDYYLKTIYKISDFEWNVPIVGTSWAIFSALSWYWWFVDTMRPWVRWRA